MAKKVINGKKYDTDKARVIGGWSNRLGYGDFNYCEETLYRAGNGSYFLVGEGGPMSKYSRSVGQNQWSGDSDVFTPLSRNEALEWCERHDIDAAAIESEFSDLLKEA